MSSTPNQLAPDSERRSAVWLAVGGALVAYVAIKVGGVVFAAVPIHEPEGSLPHWSAGAIAGLATAAIVTLLVTALVRYARAPKVLALYVVLAAALAVARDIASLPLTYARVGDPSMGEAAHGIWDAWVNDLIGDVALVLGAMAGGWVAHTVSLARIRDEGFSGDDPDGDGLSSRPERIGWAFLGWEGRPVAGDVLVAVAFVALAVVPSLVNLASGYIWVFTPALSTAEMSSSATQIFLYARNAANLVAWAVAAFWLVGRTGLRFVWLGALAAVGSSIVSVLEYSAQSLGQNAGMVGVNLINAVALLLPVAAAFVGNEIAIRRGLATLSDNTPEPDAADASADTAGGSDDTAGGTDE